MSLLDIPVWTIPPNWASPVTEGLEWLTSVLMSQTGVEQRQALRRSPRRYFEFQVTPIDEWRQYFDNLMSIPLMDLLYLPLWHEYGSMRVANVAGDSVIRVQGAPFELYNASALFVQGDKPWKYELIEVTSAVPDGANIAFGTATAPVNIWPPGTRVYPLKPARISQMPTFDRLADMALTCSIRFDLHGHNEWPGFAPDMDTYRDFPVIEIIPNEGDSQSGSYFRYVAQIDNDVGLVYSQDIGTLSFGTTGFSSMVIGRNKSDDMRGLLYALRGKLGQAWFVQPTSDFTLLGDMETADTVMTVGRAGYTDCGGPRLGRKDIRILLVDGTILYRRIIGAELHPEQDNLELLTIDTPVSAPIRPEQVSRISYLSPGRLDQDLIELAHQSDTDGVATVSLAVKTVPDQRVADDWTPTPFPDTEPGDCAPGGTAFWARVNDGPWNGDPLANPTFGIGGVDVGTIFDALFAAGFKNTGFVGGQHSTVNFGKTRFKYDVPFRAAAWSPVDKITQVGSGVTLDGDYTWSIGGEETGRGYRGGKSTVTQFGYRYFEVTVTELSQNEYVGWMTAACSLEGDGLHPDLAHGSVMVLDGEQIWVNGTPIPDISVGGYVAGDVVSVILYSTREA